MFVPIKATIKIIKYLIFPHTPIKKKSTNFYFLTPDKTKHSQNHIIQNKTLFCFTLLTIKHIFSNLYFIQPYIYSKIINEPIQITQNKIVFCFDP